MKIQSQHTMETLTITKKGKDGTLWIYEVLETCEVFSSVYEDMSSAFYDHIGNKRLTQFCDSLPTDLIELANVFETESPTQTCMVHESLPQDIFETDSLTTPYHISMGEPVCNTMKQLDQVFKEVYCNAMEEELKIIRKEECDGCKVDHPSKRRHDCLMMDAETAVEMFYDAALLRVVEENILNQFYEKIASEFDPPPNELELLKYYYFEGLKRTDYEEIKEMLIKRVDEY